MIEASAEVERQLARRLPTVRGIELEGVEAYVVQHVLGRLLVVVETTEQDVGQRVAAAVIAPVGEDRQAVRVTVARLVVDDVLVESAELQGVSALHLRQVVGEIDQMFGRKEDRVEAARVQQRRAFAPRRE